MECSYYGKWKNDFPQCVPVQPCPLFTDLAQNNTQFKLEVRYEKVVQNTNSKRQKSIPNGKYARLACIDLARRNQSKLFSEAQNNSTSVQQIQTYDSVTQVICHNGKWIGIESVNAHCLPMLKLYTQDTANKMDNSSKDEHDQIIQTGSITKLVTNDQLVSLPVLVIRILFALLAILCIVIVSLLVYMYLFKQKLTKLNSIKEDIAMCNLGEGAILPRIVYHTPEEDLSYYGGNLYERISLYQDPHMYQTIKINNDNYSDLSTYSMDSSRMGVGIDLNDNESLSEEKINSIYNLDISDDDDSHSDDDGRPSAQKESHSFHQDHLYSVPEKNLQRLTDSKDQNSNSNLDHRDDDAQYNLLSRVSSLFLHSNSLYESQ